MAHLDHREVLGPQTQGEGEQADEQKTMAEVWEGQMKLQTFSLADAASGL